MIYYSKKFSGLLVLFRFYGSALPRALPTAAVSAALAAALQLTVADSTREKWHHPYPYQAFAFITGFMLVFRCARPRGRSTVTPPFTAGPASSDFLPQCPT
jgi:hypothetical protein